MNTSGLHENFEESLEPRINCDGFGIQEPQGLFTELRLLWGTPHRIPTWIQPPTWWCLLQSAWLSVVFEEIITHVLTAHAPFQCPMKGLFMGFQRKSVVSCLHHSSLPVPLIPSPCPFVPVLSHPCLLPYTQHEFLKGWLPLRWPERKIGNRQAYRKWQAKECTGVRHCWLARKWVENPGTLNNLLKVCGWAATRKQGWRRSMTGDRPDPMSVCFLGYLMKHRLGRGNGKQWGLKRLRKRLCERSCMKS